MKTVGLTLRVDEARERRDAVDQAWYPLLSSLGLRVVLIPNDPEPIGGLGQLLEDLGLDGLILTGGNDLSEVPEPENPAPERDALEARLIDESRLRDLPLLGVCRGLQKLVVHYGGRLSRVEGHVACLHGLEVVGPGLPALKGRNAVNSYHGLGVWPEDLGSQLSALALSPDGTVEAVAHRSAPQWGIMWHPERDPRDPRDAELILYCLTRRQSEFAAVANKL